MKLCVISCCYEHAELAQIFADSCLMHDLPLVMCEAKELRGVWNGDMRLAKIAGPLQVFDALLSSGYTHALWADAFDSLFCKSASSIMYRYWEMGAPPMVFAAEKNCWPDETLRSDYHIPASGSEYRYLNAGGWLGHIEYMKWLFRDTLDKRGSNHPNDQEIWSERLVGGFLPGACLDTERKIFQSMWGTEESEVSDPCVIHYNGGTWRDGKDTRRVDRWERMKV